ncbi:MAG: ABC transporter ATP-binding protein [Candidatus Dojkabacteria bacterium]|jgi:ABC-type multidrug transport system fused ATPase/permease subunit|nr:ABC transporter ATP-binding protein [Candidatus Dojkabacteria bacterium]
MSKKKPLSFKDYIDISIWSLKINWKMSPFITVTTFFTTIYRNLTGLINIYIVARIIDSLIRLIGTSDADLGSILPLVLLLGLVQLFTIIANNLDSYINRYRRRLSQSYMAQIEYEKIAQLGVQTNQLPNVANKRQIAHDWIHGITDVNQNIVRIVAAIIQSLISALIVFNFSLWIGFAVIFIAMLSYLQSRYYYRKDFDWQTSDGNAQGKRKSWWIHSQLSDPDALDEITLVGAYRYLDLKFRNFFDYFNGGYKKILKADVLTTFVVDLLNLFVVLGGSVQIFLMALKKVITIGDTTFYVGAINNFYGGVSWLSAELVLFTDLVMKEKEVYEFFKLEPEVKDGEIKMDRLINPPSVEFKGVSFHYPNSKRNILENFSFKISAGEKIAIVGENGAGKSTIVKLLCRIYDPQKGEILVNGINLKELTINDWYKNVGVLFQDFNFYGNLTVEENIYIGKSIKEIDRERVIEAAKNADAHDFILKYEKKYKTIMSERFDGGIKPSKGQKQKIAIARFFYRDAPFAIFDEPTSAIDADAEYKIFNRIYNFFDNKTVMIISHRFSTVRNADRIIVVRDGKIIEEGTHRELIGINRVYADNFRKQAEGYV